MVVKTVMPQFNITIIPQDNSIIDKETFIAAQRDGVNDFEAIKTWENKIADKTDKHSSKILQFFNEIDQLNNYDFLPLDVSYELKLQMIDMCHYRDGSEVESLKDSLEGYPDTYNPYKINQRYLSVFKVIFSNQTDSIVKINADNFQIISGTEQLSPIKTDYFEKNLTGGSEKLKNIFRMNLSENIPIVPHQTVAKYFAVPAINLDIDQLIVKYISANKILDFDFAITKEKQLKTFNFQEYQVKSSNYVSSPFYYVVIKEGNRVFSLKGNEVFTLADQKNTTFSIYCAFYDGFSNRYGKKVYNKSSIGRKNTLIIPTWAFETIQKHPNNNYNAQ
jgi:hypothetical protein